MFKYFLNLKQKSNHIFVLQNLTMNEFIISFMIISLFTLIYWIIEYINKKRKLKNLSDYSFSNSPHKILKEEDHVICFLFLKTGYFLSGQMNGMISVYNYKDFNIFALILEHCEPITSLFEMNDGKILTSSADGTLKKIRLLFNNDNKKNKKYLVEFVFFKNREFIFKSIQMKNSDDILSSNLEKELILWKKTENEIELYKINKILLKDEYVQDIYQINEKIFITCGESLLCWDVNNYESIKKLKYESKGNNSIYKINEDLTGIFLKKRGDILLFNNNELIGVKIINISEFSLTSLKSLKNKTILVGIFDEKNKKSFINQYILNLEMQNTQKEKSVVFNKTEMIKIKEEEVNYTDNDFYFGEFNWSRINIIEEIDNFVFLGVGGQEKLKNFGKLIIYNKKNY